jgi:hypothetical protein
VSFRLVAPTVPLNTALPIDLLCTLDDCIWVHNADLLRVDHVRMIHLGLKGVHLMALNLGAFTERFAGLNYKGGERLIKYRLLLTVQCHLNR